jgi:hypothetical protein
VGVGPVSLADAVIEALAPMTCAWCEKPFERTTTMGPVPRYCSGSCRQRAYEQRRLERLISEALAPYQTEGTNP